jgi:mitogen-activated protein kinase kinase 3
MIKEIKILTEVDCDCIVPIKGAWHNEGNIGIILEYMDHGSLEFMCNEKIEVDEQALAAVVCQILWGLSYLHFDNRVHRDIKPANVLIDSVGSVKLSDFGISTALQNTGTIGSAVGSYRYMAPERLLAEKYDQSSDIWSVGIMVIQLWTKIYPFHYCCYPVDLHTELETIDFSIFLEELGFPPQLKTFLLRILVREPGQRATAEELLEDEWFQTNQITELGVATEVVKSWLADNVTSSPDYKSPLDVSPTGRSLHAAGDDVFDDSYGDKEHPLLTPRGAGSGGSRGDDSGANSRDNSIKTELSIDNNNNINGSGSKLGQSGGSFGSGRDGSSPEIMGTADELLDGTGMKKAQQERLERLNRMLPVSAKFEKTAEDIEDDLLIGSGTHQSSGGGGHGEKRARDFTLSSSRSSAGSTTNTSTCMSLASKTQSTANYTTGSHDITIGNTNFEVPVDGINFDEGDEGEVEEEEEVEENMYYTQDDFEEPDEGDPNMATANEKKVAGKFDEDYWKHK